MKLSLSFSDRMVCKVDDDGLVYKVHVNAACTCIGPVQVINAITTEFH